MLIKRKGGWRIEFDRKAARDQQTSDDPGQYTPVMVQSPEGKRGTENMVISLGSIDGYTIPKHIYQWIEQECDRFWLSV